MKEETLEYFGLTEIKNSAPNNTINGYKAIQKVLSLSETTEIPDNFYEQVAHATTLLIAVDQYIEYDSVFKNAAEEGNRSLEKDIIKITIQNIVEDAHNTVINTADEKALQEIIRKQAEEEEELRIIIAQLQENNKTAEKLQKQLDALLENPSGKQEAEIKEIEEKIETLQKEENIPEVKKYGPVEKSEFAKPNKIPQELKIKENTLNNLSADNFNAIKKWKNNIKEGQIETLNDFFPAQIKILGPYLDQISVEKLKILYSMMTDDYYISDSSLKNIIAYIPLIDDIENITFIQYLNDIQIKAIAPYLPNANLKNLSLLIEALEIQSEDDGYPYSPTFSKALPSFFSDKFWKTCAQHSNDIFSDSNKLNELFDYLVRNTTSNDTQIYWSVDSMQYGYFNGEKELLSLEKKSDINTHDPQKKSPMLKGQTLAPYKSNIFELTDALSYMIPFAENKMAFLLGGGMNPENLKRIIYDEEVLTEFLSCSEEQILTLSLLAKKDIDYCILAKGKMKTLADLLIKHDSYIDKFHNSFMNFFGFKTKFEKWIQEEEGELVLNKLFS